MMGVKKPFILFSAFTIFFLFGTFCDDEVAAEDSLSSGNLRGFAINMAKKLIGDQKTEIENALKRKDISSDERDRLKKEYTKLEKNIDRYANGFSQMWDALDNVKKGIKDLDRDARLGYKMEQELNLSWHAAKSLKDAGFVDWWNMADKGVSFVANLQKVNDNLKLADNLGKSGPGRSIARNLSMLTSAMSWFGDKVPLIGPFIKQYGDVGAEMLNGIYALDKQIRASEGGQLNDGVHGDRKVMLEKLRLLDIQTASQVEGLKDVFAADENGGQLVVWDKEAEKFLLLKGLKGSAGQIAVRNRYLQLAKAGNYNPTATQIADFTSVIALSFAEVVFEVQPGQLVQLTPVAKFAEVAAGTERPVAAHPLVIKTIPADAGTFVGSTDYRLGQSFQWKAPAEADQRVQFVVDLAPEVQTVVHAIKPLKTSIYTSSPTTIRLETASTTVAPGQQFSVRGVVYDAAGKPIPKLKSQGVKIRADWYQGLSQSVSTEEMTGEEAVWRAPTKPGTYNITATFAGGHVKGWLSNSSYLGSTATLPITVRPLQYAIAADVTDVVAVTAGAPAKVNVTITNQESQPINFSLGLKGAAEEKLWNVSAASVSIDVPPGQAVAIPVEISLKDVARAENFALRISAEPMNAKPGKAVDVRFRNDDPNASANQILGCDAVRHQECRTKIEADMNPQIEACKAKGQNVKAFTCGMEVTVEGAAAMKKCAVENQCEFSKSDEAWANLAQKRLTCINQNAGGNINQCMGAGDDIPVCNEAAYKTCETTARTYFEQTAKRYCDNTYTNGSCDWFRCTKEVEADYKEKKAKCFEDNLCEVEAGLLDAAVVIRKNAQCISKNEYECKSCLAPAEAAQNDTYVTAETLKKQALVENPPPEKTPREKLVSHLPPGVLSATPTMTTVAGPTLRTTATPQPPQNTTPPQRTDSPAKPPAQTSATVPPGGPPADPSIGAGLGIKDGVPAKPKNDVPTKPDDEAIEQVVPDIRVVRSHKPDGSISLSPRPTVKGEDVHIGWIMIEASRGAFDVDGTMLRGMVYESNGIFGNIIWKGPAGSVSFTVSLHQHNPATGSPVTAQRTIRMNAKGPQ